MSERIFLYFRTCSLKLLYLKEPILNTSINTSLVLFVLDESIRYKSCVFSPFKIPRLRFELSKSLTYFPRIPFKIEATRDSNIFSLNSCLHWQDNITFTEYHLHREARLQQKAYVMSTERTNLFTKNHKFAAEIFVFPAGI